MPEALGDALSSPGLPWLAAIFVAAGLVRGFAGFGTALVAMPVATLFLPLPLAIAILGVVDMLIQPLVVPGAWGKADRREVGALALAAIVATPVGVWLLTWVDEGTLRWAVALVAAITLLALTSGWRFHGRLTAPGLTAIGAASGLIGGATGLAGPPVILFYLASAAGAATVRANTILFLAAIDVVILVNLSLAGLIDAKSIWLALILFLPYSAALLVGQRLFAPSREKLYRRLAFTVIAASILTGLPVFDESHIPFFGQ